MSRLNAETAMYGRWAGLLNFVYNNDQAPSFSVATPMRPVLPTGSTELYNDPLGFALSLVGHPSGTPWAVTSDDLASSSSKWFVMLDLAEYRLIRNILGSFVDIDETDNGRSQDYASLADRAADRVMALEKLYGTYFTNLKPLQSGTIQLPFITKAGPEF